MFKKVLLGLLAAGVVAILIVGAVNRTASRTGETVTGGNGRRGGDGVAVESLDPGILGGETRGQGNGGGRRSQAAAGVAQPAEGLAVSQAIMEWQTIDGVVAGVATDLLTVHATDGQTVEVEGQPWAFAQQAGFAPQVGDSITLVGYDEAGEFKVAEMMNTSTSQSVTLRDATGRPGWSGRGQGRKRG
jgi:hypothetical protein